MIIVRQPEQLCLNVLSTYHSAGSLVLLHPELSPWRRSQPANKKATVTINERSPLGGEGGGGGAPVLTLRHQYIRSLKTTEERHSYSHVQFRTTLSNEHGVRVDYILIKLRTHLKFRSKNFSVSH